MNVKFVIILRLKNVIWLNIYPHLNTKIGKMITKVAKNFYVIIVEININLEADYLDIK